MANWFKDFFLGSSGSRETQRQQQNDWIKQSFKTWQATWHDVFDGDAALDAAGEFERPDPLPDDIGFDYRVIFGLSHATPETRRLCFGLFPNGQEMQRRFESYLTSQQGFLTEDEARKLVAEAARHIDRTDPNGAIDLGIIDVVQVNAPDATNRLYRTSSASDLFERNQLPVAKKELPAVAAQLFLTEPLYASAGNYYEVCHWVTAAMFDRHRDRIYELQYRLWRGKWQLLLAETGVILADRREG